MKKIIYAVLSVGLALSLAFAPDVETSVENADGVITPLGCPGGNGGTGGNCAM